MTSPLMSLPGDPCQLCKFAKHTEIVYTLCWVFIFSAFPSSELLQILRITPFCHLYLACDFGTSKKASKLVCCSVFLKPQLVPFILVPGAKISSASLGAAQLQSTDVMSCSWPRSIWQEISVWALYRFLISLQEAKDEAESDNLTHASSFMTILWLVPLIY